MAAKSFTLIDTDKDICEDAFVARGGGAAGYAVTQETLRGGLRDGVTVLRVDNGKFRFDLLPTRGMGLWKASLGELHLGWESPVRGPVHPAFVPLAEPSGLGWLDGFDEWMVRCGLESNGAPEFDEQGTLLYPLHGRIANKPAHYLSVAIDEDQESITITGVVEETRFHFLKMRLTSTITTRFGQPGLAISDSVQNLSGSPGEIQMLYHVNFGAPLLDAGSSVVAPAKTIVPRNEHAASGVDQWWQYPAEQTGYEEQVYFLELFANADNQTRVLLKNAHGTHGASLKFSKRSLPCFTVWKNTTSRGDGYVTGLEPGTNFPNPRSFEGEHDRVARLQAGESITFELEIEAHADPDAVDRAAAAVAALQQETAKLYRSPQPTWCAP
jgi:hypothetical protein